MQNIHIFRTSISNLEVHTWRFPTVTLCGPLYLFYNENRGSYFVLLYVECCNRSLNTCSSTRSWVMMNKTLFPHLEILYFKWPSHQERKTRQVKHFKFFGDIFSWRTDDKNGDKNCITVWNTLEVPKLKEDFWFFVEAIKDEVGFKWDHDRFCTLSVHLIAEFGGRGKLSRGKGKGTRATGKLEAGQTWFKKSWQILIVKN